MTKTGFVASRMTLSATLPRNKRLEAPRIHGELLKLGFEVAESIRLQVHDQAPTPRSRTSATPTQPCGRDRGDRPAALMPKMDVTETDKEIEITAELPGLEEKDVQIKRSDICLLSAVRRRPKRSQRIKTIGSSNAAMARSSVRSSCRKASTPMPSRRTYQKACSR